MLIPDLSGLAQGIGSVGTSLGQVLQEAAKQRVLKSLFNKEPTDSAPPPYQPGSQPTSATQAPAPYQAPVGYQDMAGVEGQPQQQGYQPQQQGYTPEQAPYQTPSGALQNIVGAPQQTPYEKTVSDTNTYFQRQQMAIDNQKKRAQQAFIVGDKSAANMLMQDAYHQEQMLQQERLQSQKSIDKRYTELDKRAFEENKPYFERINKIRAELPQKEATLLSIRDALIDAGGDVSKIRNFIASFFPGEIGTFLSTAPAQQLTSFVKDFFVGELREIPGLRLNQMIEGNIKTALQSPGKTEESNQILTEFQQFKNDILGKEVEIADRLKNKYLKMGIEPPRNFQEQVFNELKSYFIERQNELIQTNKDIKSGKFKSPQMLNMPFAKAQIRDNPPKEGFTWIMDPKGNPVQAPTNELDVWLNSGGKLIK